MATTDHVFIPPAPAEADDEGAGDDSARSLRNVRLWLGRLGFALPFAMLAAAALPWVEFKSSVSHFYHSPAGDVLVGCLWAIGIFLIAYKGYRPTRAEREGKWWQRLLTDRRLAVTAGISAIGVAIFPVDPVPGAPCPAPEAAPGLLCGVSGITRHGDFIAENFLHFASALVFFACICLFCFVMFPKGTKGAKARLVRVDADKNRIYRLCGWAILGAMIFLGFYTLAESRGWAVFDWLAGWHAFFWGEVAAIWAFALAWTVKSHSLDAPEGDEAT